MDSNGMEAQKACMIRIISGIDSLKLAVAMEKDDFVPVEDIFPTEKLAVMFGAGGWSWTPLDFK